MAGSNDIEIRVRVRSMVREGLAGAVRDARVAGGQAGGAFGDQFTRDANGRLHDQRGRYVSEGALAGRSYGQGFGGSLKETFGKAFKDAGIAATLLTNPVGGLIGSATALSGSLLLIPAAVGAAGAAFAALKIGMSGFGDAIKSMDDPAKFAEALKKLSPEAAKTAVAVKSMSPAFKELKTAVQDGLFYDMAREVKNVGANLLPMLTDKLEATGSRLNEMGTSLTKFLSSAQAKNDLSAMLKNTNSMLGNMKPVLSNLVSGFLSLGAAGSKFLPQFGTWLADITGKFAAWAKSANDSGKAQEWIRNALDEFKQLGGILKDLGSIAKSLFEAMGDSSILETIHGITSGVAEWLAKNKELLPILLNIFAAWKAFSAVKGILTGITAGMSALAGAAGRASTASGGFVGNMKLLKGLGAAAGLAVLADQLDKANVAAAGGAENLTGWNDQLHDFVEMGKQIGSGDFGGIFDEIGQEWDDMISKFKQGDSPIGAMFGNDSIKVGDQFKKVLQGLDTTWLQWRTALAPAQLKITGDLGPVQADMTRVIDFANGQKATVTINGDGTPALVTVDGVRYTVDSTTGIMTLDANQDPALDRLGGTKVTIDQTTGRLTIDANDAPAKKKIATLIASATQTVYLQVNATVGTQFSNLFKASGGAANRGLTLVGERGPELVSGMASGGAARGGMRLVGANGPELAALGAGSRVLPYSNTAQTLRDAAGGQGGGSAGDVHVHFSGDVTSPLATVIMRMIRSGQIQISASNIKGLR